MIPMTTTTIKERPILFSGPMVRAILDGKKSQTRRVAPIHWDTSKHWGDYDCWTFYKGKRPTIGFSTRNRGQEALVGFCPYGHPGDHLWVRETFYVQPELWGRGRGPQPTHYAVDTAPEQVEDYVRKPLIFMPRWASRITLEITEVRVQRVGEITEEDARAEGIREVTKDGDVKKYCVYDRGDMSSSPWAEMPRTACGAYRILWDSINAKRGFGWDKSPWVWVIEFTRVAD